MKGTDIILAALRRHGVDTVFGYPGAAMIPLFDTFHDAPDIRFILPRHEQGGIHAAEGYARATGRPGVVFVTSGPGATNLVTGIANAFMDSTPLVIFTGQVKRHLIGNDAFQEVDTTGITRPITKHNYLVTSPEELPGIICTAFHLATHGRPGPVLIDLPVDVATAEIAAGFPETIDLPGFRPVTEGNDRQIQRAAMALNASKRPVILAGGGIIHSGCSELVDRFARKGPFPVATTLMALGAFSGDDSLWLGMPGMHGTVAANRAIMECDCLISIGARFDDRVTGPAAQFAPEATIIHIDIDPSSIGKSVHADIPLVGDAGRILGKLIALIDPSARSEWHARIAAWKAEHPLAYAMEGLPPQYPIETLSELIRGRKAIVATDVGQHQMWTALFARFHAPRTFITSGGLGTMGFGLPAAIGAQLGQPDHLVVAVTGDGSIQMNMQEFATIRHNNLPIKVMIMDNGHLGMVRQWQDLFYQKRYAQTVLSGNPDFVKLAAAFDIPAERITDCADVAGGIRRMIETPGPFLLDVMVNQEENVYPMVPAGQAINRSITAAPSFVSA